MTIIETLFISGILFFALVGTSNAQTKTMSGTVIDNPRGMYLWAAIVIQVGSRRYYVLTECGKCPNTKIVGTVDEIGRNVRISYTRILKSQDYDGEIRPTRIVEIKKARK